MSDSSNSDRYDLSSKRRTFLGLSKDVALKGLFGGNALVSLIVLALITIFLFKEGVGFFGQYRNSLQLYRDSGLEYVEIMREEQESLTALNRYLNAIMAKQVDLMKAEGAEFSEIKAAQRDYEDFVYGFEDLSYELGDHIFELSDTLLEARNQYQSNENLREHRMNLIEAGKIEQADEVVIQTVDLASVFAKVKQREPEFMALNDRLRDAIGDLMANPPTFEREELQEMMDRFGELVDRFLSEMDVYERRLQQWSRGEDIEMFDAITAFLFGKKWVTNSSLQDWYGLAPLFSGSLLVSVIAMLIAVPLGVGAAIYVNQVASQWEQNLIKPYIEFISAIPSVVIGFFGIAVFGSFLRGASNTELLSWIPFFPLNERLMAFTAGGLLALMAIPTIFTLAEDAINNVPGAYKEASLAMGATRLQTITKIIVPTSLSGIISAILLGFGRVIGETMVVLLCAGNRIAIPDFSAGLGVFFQPVHTMTGIIAQELGEVVPGSVHYRALFMVGMTLFIISLTINYFAQKIVIRYQISRG